MNQVIDKDRPEAAGMIAGTTVSRIVGARNAAISKMETAIGLMQQGAAMAVEARDTAQLAHGGAAFHDGQHHLSRDYTALFHSFDPGKSLESWRRHIDARTWMALFSQTGMDGLMDATAKAQLNQDLRGSVPEVTEDAVFQILGDLVADAQTIFQRGLAKCFSDLDRRFKSHDVYKLGSRIILTHAFGTWGMNDNVAATITDIERVSIVLDGDPKPKLGGLVAAIKADRGHGWDPRQSVTHSDYFKVRTFKNGNAHLWFTRDDLVEKANLVLADWYGEVLADGVPREAEIKPGTALSKDLAFYRTPKDAAQFAFRDAWLSGRVLEPSAGDGALVRWLLECWDEAAKAPWFKQAPLSIVAYEAHGGRSAQLDAIASSDSRVTSIRANFLQALPTGDFDQVVMNPPFAGTHYIDHVLHAWEFLAPGGKLMAILPITARLGQDPVRQRFQDWVEARCDYGCWSDLPAQSFKTSGTNVNTTVLTLRKPRVTEAA